MLYFTYDEFKKFIAQAEDIRWKTIYEILYYCGLRRGEIRALTWKDIKFKNRTLSVNKQITDRCGSVKDFHFTSSKTKNSIRTIPITKVLLEDLKLLKEQNMKIHDFNDDYFVCGDAFPISSNALSTHKNEYCKLARLLQIRLHDFRHSCASLLINKGANVTIVTKYLGHTKIEETLNTYSYMFTGAMNEVVNLIDNLNEES